MPEYGANITYASFPDYDEVGWDSYWGCTDWMIWYNRLEQHYGTQEARFRWKSAWEQQGTFSGTWDCLCNDQFREFVETNQLGLESYIADVVTSTQDIVTNTFSSFGWLSKNLKWIIPVGLVVVGAGYLYFQGSKIKGAADITKLLE